MKNKVHKLWVVAFYALGNLPFQETNFSGMNKIWNLRLFSFKPHHLLTPSVSFSSNSSISLSYCISTSDRPLPSSTDRYWCIKQNNYVSCNIYGPSTIQVWYSIHAYIISPPSIYKIITEQDFCAFDFLKMRQFSFFFFFFEKSSFKRPRYQSAAHLQANKKLSPRGFSLLPLCRQSENIHRRLHEFSPHLAG